MGGEGYFGMLRNPKIPPSPHAPPSPIRGIGLFQNTTSPRSSQRSLNKKVELIQTHLKKGKLQRFVWDERANVSVSKMRVGRAGCV